MIKDKIISSLFRIIVLASIIFMVLFSFKVSLNRKAAIYEIQIEKIDEVANDLIVLERNSTNLARAIIITGMFEKISDYQKIINDTELKIKSFKNLINEEGQNELDAISKANLHMAFLEKKGIELAKNNSQDEGRDVLDGITYAYYKSLYYSKLFEVAKESKNEIFLNLNEIKRQLYFLNVFSILIEGMLVIILLLLIKKLKKSSVYQLELIKEIEKNNRELDFKVKERTKELQSEIEKHEITEKSLLEKQNFITTLINNIKATIYMQDLNGKIIIINRVLPNLIDAKNIDVIGMIFPIFYQRKL